jgi:hypothetical protein
MMTKRLFNDGNIEFDDATWKRLRRMNRYLKISYVDFVVQSVHHALDEFEADLRGGRT